MKHFSVITAAIAYLAAVTMAAPAIEPNPNLMPCPTIRMPPGAIMPIPCNPTTSNTPKPVTSTEPSSSH
ncbi:hypothetical protein NP233_g268 [Leucocoprinus birnbaumii]|uniref:Uncharacterized protein n=1 Tax=Leucocoprinus birnbaumii TaxID=56174 RepID=A0AAD5W2G7_9AGAR|nr:hypothetical protein NP233_g268 [Leucocoprinus birnbaumii]